MSTYRAEVFRPSDHPKGGHIRQIGADYDTAQAAAEAAQNDDLKAGETALVTEWDKWGEEVGRHAPNELLISA